jgi:hypothetical protein
VKLTPDDFEIWRTSPLTQLVLDRFLGAEQDRTEAQLIGEAWEGPMTPERHAALRERYETLGFVRGADFEQLNDWLTERED